MAPHQPGRRGVAAAAARPPPPRAVCAPGALPARRRRRHVTPARDVRACRRRDRRRGELCDLRWSDIAFADDLHDDDDGWGDDSPDFGVVPAGAAAILIDSAIGIAGGTAYVKGTKTSRDNVPAIIVDPGTAETLRQHRLRCVRDALLAGVPLADTAFVFSRRPGGLRPWRPSSATHEYAKVRTRAVARIRGDAEHDIAPDPAVPDRRRDAFAAAVARVQLRQLRHFVATQLGAAGVPAATISGRLRHSRTSTTQDVYTAALATPDHQAAAILGALLDGTG